MRIQLSLDLFKMQLLKQTFTFVHPLAILAAKNENPAVDLKFDLKANTQFQINQLMDLNILVADNMRANFNKKLDKMFKEAIKFAVTAVEGEEYEAPEDDTKNIANAANYYPNLREFVPGGPVFTNPWASPSASRRIPTTRWDFTLMLDLIRFVTGDDLWTFKPVVLLNHWIFKTRDNTLNTVLP